MGVLLRKHLFSILIFLLCAAQVISSVQNRTPLYIELSGDWNESEREYSGAARYDDSVVLTPQYPGRIGNRVIQLPAKDLFAALKDGKEYEPRPILFDDDGLSSIIEGFEGFEAIAFDGSEVFMTIESHRETGMIGYLVRGKTITKGPDLTSIRLIASSRIELPPRAKLSNMTDEAIVILPNRKLLTLYEANGAGAVVNPRAYQFDTSGEMLKRLPDVPVPNIEYRITDCSSADESGRFWCINYMWPGDQAKLKPGPDSILERWGMDPSHSLAWTKGNRVVERLVLLQFNGNSIQLTDTPPIYLKLREDGEARNWEGLSFLPGKGFFIATDKFPKTLLAYIPQ